MDQSSLSEWCDNVQERERQRGQQFLARLNNSKRIQEIMLFHNIEMDAYTYIYITKIDHFNKNNHSRH